MKCARQRYNLGYFHFTGHRCIEKLMTEFRIDDCTIKRGKLVCISVIQCHLSDPTLHTCYDRVA